MENNEILIKVPTTKLVYCLTNGGSMSGKSKLMPILDCVLLKFGGNKLTISSFSGETAISCSVILDEPIGVDFSFCARFAEIMPFMRKIDDEETSILYSPEKNSYSIFHKYGKAEFSSFPSEDFPSFVSEAVFDDVESVSFEVADRKALCTMLYQAMNFTSDDQIRPALTGIQMTYENDKLSVCASDCHILYVNAIDCVTNEDSKKGSVILPGETALALCRSIPVNENKGVKICFNDRHIGIKTDELSISSTCINSKFPNVSAVIPTSHTSSLSVPVSQMIDSIDRLSISCDKISQLIKVKYDASGTISLETENLTYKSSAIEKIEAIQCEGEMTIGFKRTSFLTCLNCVETENANFYGTSSNKAMVIKETKEDSNKLLLIMPCVLVN